MRIAIISDVHGNLTALEAVLTDLRQQKPDVIFHGGDIPYGGCNPCEVIDCVIQEGWQGLWATPTKCSGTPAPVLDWKRSRPSWHPSLWVFQHVQQI